MHIKIQIDPSQLKGQDKAQVSLFFTKVAESSRLGHHRFFIEEKLARWISKNVLLIDMHRQRIIEIGNSPATKGFDLDSTTPFLEVVYGDEVLSVQNNKWRIGHIDFVEQNFHEQSILLVEGYSDCDFYEFLFKVESKRKKTGHFNFYVLPSGGKGNMVKGIERHSRKSGVIVCIFDSDLYVPKGKLSEEFADAEEYSKNNEVRICHVTKTPGHEAENFIPIDIIHKVSDNNSIASKKLLKSLFDKPGQAVKGQCLSLFYDYREGVTIEKAIKNCVNEEQKIWLKNKYSVNLNQLPKYRRKTIALLMNDGKAMSEFEEFVCGKGERDWVELFSEWFEELFPYLTGEIESVT